MESCRHGHQEMTAHSDLKTPSEYSWWEASVEEHGGESRVSEFTSVGPSIVGD